MTNEQQHRPISEFRLIKISHESLAWLLETLRDLAPADVRARLVEAGTLPAGDPDLPPAATWSEPSQYTDCHENMGTAVEGIVEELTAPECELESIAAQLYGYVGSNGQDGDAGELLEQFNAWCDARYPRGHRGLV